MDSKELRIGNYVEYKHLKNGVFYGYDTVTNIDLNGISISCCKYTAMTIDSIKPIPLTEEWLVKFGLQHKSFSFDHERLHKDIGVGYNGDDFINNEMSLLYKKKVFFKIQYVHQLQNLYFALTNEELTIK